MATSAELIREENKELLLSRVNDIVFVDALAGFECRRCERTLIRHYVAHCGHYFCANCKRVLTLSKSNCPLPSCKQSLGDIDLQNVEFERKLYDLRAHCPNKKYGCKYMSQLKDVGGHLRVCKDTREAALPVEIHPPGALELVLRELSVKFDKLSADVSKIKEDSNKIEAGLKVIETKVDDNKDDIEKKMAEMIKKFDGKSSETINSLKDVKVEMDKKINSLKAILDNNNVGEIKAEFDKTILDMKAEVDKKITETIQKFDGKSSETVNSLKDIKVDMDKKIKNIETKVDSTNLIEKKAEIDRKITEMTRKLEEKVNKTEVENKFRNLTAEIEMSKTNTQKGDLIEINRKLETINKEANDKYSKMSLELAKMDTKIKENKTYTEGKVNELIPPLSRKLDDKMYELNARITKLTNTTEENKLLIKSNKSTELNNLEQKVSNLENLISLTNLQIDNVSLSEGKSNLLPNFAWTINGIANRVSQTTYEITSEWFEWTGYPVRAQAKLEVKQNGVAHMSLIIKENNNGKAIDIKSIPTVYYVLRDRSKNSDPKHRSKSYPYLFASTFKNTIDYSTPFVHKSWLKEPLYNANDSVVIEIYVEPPSMAQQVLSRDGILSCTIDNFQKRKQMEKEELVWYQECPYFYTAPNGYRVRVRMWLIGYGEFKGKGLTAEIGFLTGEFDADLSRSFPHTTTITLFNRKDPRRNITKTVSQDVKTSRDYEIDMCSDKEIKNVIENDTLFYNVTIKPVH